MSSPLDSQSDRIFTDDEDEVGSCTGSSPKQRNGTCSTPCQIGKTPKRRRILPAMFDSSGAEESDEENSQTQDLRIASPATVTVGYIVYIVEKEVNNINISFVFMWKRYKYTPTVAKLC